MKKMRTQGTVFIHVLVVLGCLAACTSQVPTHAPAIPPNAVVGVREPQLKPEFWIARESHAKQIVLDTQQIAEQNARLAQLDPTVHDLGKFPAALNGSDVRHQAPSATCNFRNCRSS